MAKTMHVHQVARTFWQKTSHRHPDLQTSYKQKAWLASKDGMLSNIKSLRRRVCAGDKRNTGPTSVTGRQQRENNLASGPHPDAYAHYRKQHHYDERIIRTIYKSYPGHQAPRHTSPPRTQTAFSYNSQATHRRRLLL
ncbi:uncharacterized protein LOC125572464 [Nematostella vectensis]|uniref:uncharacterized protein LOC125572464 n=1 Tax=Nematostella vectensis TaxID=45351 RepID=UPI002077825A|nr:uncharacterized protein LOC125572464 [Nematostella vectensis]